MLDEIYEVSFQIIMHGGDARSKALEAIRASDRYEFEKAEALIKEAKESLKKAQEAQTGLIQKEAAGDRQEVNIILIHSQDHFSMAMTSIDLSEQVLRLNRKIQALEQRESQRNALEEQS
ncbi:PTS lactose/cellobiose transporter subunit IIA [Hungatella effluvii]|uniref:PTS lactose/cellobiose transporter subunit IIA n=1 Tax=Hungatella effluvii TaxID=1096246 RepID=UPI002A81DECD|nr:PTS lactose/cellobiose transporter subunit IIA [Hungatella effluvii]